MNYTDLHVHSTYSDGTLPPSELVFLAKEKGLMSFALTDHDTVEGIPEAVSAARAAGIELIPGIELSSRFGQQDIHIVGLDIPYEQKAFQDRLHELQSERSRRNEKMAALMASDGIDISIDQLHAAYGNKLLTRAHFARYLAEHGYVRNMWDAFDTHIGDHCKYYVPREKFSPQDAVSLITEFRGIPILAHPFQYHMNIDELRVFIRPLKEAGLIGVEALYSTHSGKQEREIRTLAKSMNLCISGGSDFHGSNKPSIYLGTGHGNLRIPCDLIDKMRARKQQNIF